MTRPVAGKAPARGGSARWALLFLWPSDPNTMAGAIQVSPETAYLCVGSVEGTRPCDLVAAWAPSRSPRQAPWRSAGPSPERSLSGAPVTRTQSEARLRSAFGSCGCLWAPAKSQDAERSCLGSGCPRGGREPSFSRVAGEAQASSCPQPCGGLRCVWQGWHDTGFWLP